MKSSILIFEKDNELSAGLISIMNVFHKNEVKEIVWVDSLKNFKNETLHKHYDIVFVDVDLQKDEKPKLFQILKGLERYTHIVALSYMNDDYHQYESFMGGARQYLIKDELTSDTINDVIQIRKLY